MDDKNSDSDGKVDLVEVARTHTFDRDGQPLNPQPSNDPADPLNWPMTLKVRS